MFFTLNRFWVLLLVFSFGFNFSAWSETDFKSFDFKDDPLEARLSLTLSKEFSYQIKELKTPSRIVVTFKEKLTCKTLEPLTSESGLIRKVRFLTLSNKATEKTGIYNLDSIIIETADNVIPKVFFKGDKMVIRVLSGVVTASEKEKPAAESSPEKPAPVSKPMSPEAMGPVLSNVTVNEIGTKTRLVLSLSKRAEYTAKEMKDPYRTVLTFKEKIFCKNTEPLSFNRGTVKTIRFLTLKNKAAESAGLYLLDTLIIEYAAEVKEALFFKKTELVIDSEIVQKPAEESSVSQPAPESFPAREEKPSATMTPEQLNPLFNSAEIREDGDKSRLIFSFTKGVEVQTKELTSPKRVLLTFREKILSKSIEPLISSGLIKNVRFLTLKNKATKKTGLMFLDSVIIELNEDARYKVSRENSLIHLEAELDTEKMMAVADAAIKQEKAEENEMPVFEDNSEEQPAAKPGIEELAKNYTFLNQVDFVFEQTKNQIQFSFSKLPDYKLNELANPTRLVMTFGEKILSKTAEPKTFESGTVKNLRYLTLKNQAFEEAGFYVVDSLIVEISEESVYEISKDGTLITLNLFAVGEKKVAGEQAVSPEKQRISTVEKTAQVSEKDSQQIESLLKSAKENYKNGYYLLAKSDCQTVLGFDPANEEALKILGRAQEKIAEEKEKALKLADQLIAEKEASVDTQKAQAARLAGDLEKQMIEKGSREEEFSAYMKNGQGLFKRKRYEEALEMWERALEIKPDDAELKDYMNRAREKIRERGQVQETETISTRQQSEIDVLMSQGEEQFHNLQYTNAIATFEKVLELDPKNVKAMRYVVQARKNQRSYVAEGGMPEDIVMKPVGAANDLGMITIDEALKMGLANHLPTKISQEEVFLAKYKVDEAKRQLYPQAKVKYKLTGGTTTGEDFEGQEYGMEFEQNVWSGGKYRALYNQARVNLAVARKNHEKTKAEFIFEVIQAYYNYVFAKEKMKNKLVLKGNIIELLDIAEKQYNAKALTLAEILEARSQLEEVNFQVVQIENDLELAKLALQQLLSQPSKVDIDVGEMPEPFIFDLDEAKLNEVAYKNRRDYQVNKLLVLFHKYGLEIAHKKEGLNVQLTGSYGMKDEYYVTEQVDMKSEYYIGLKFSRALGPHTAELNLMDQDKVPQIGQTTSSQFTSEELTIKLWDQKNQTALTEANISYHKALSELENSKRTLVHDIRSSIYSVAEAEAKIQNDKSILALSAEELRSTKAKQKADQSTIVQVMRAEAKFWNEKTDMVSDQADYYINIAKLNKNVGLNNYMDPATGLISTDKEEQAPGIRLVVHDKEKKRHWYNILPFKGGIKSYYPDEVVTDILKEKQEKAAFASTKSFLNITRWFKKSAEDEMAEYKQYDEKYNFSTPLKDEKQSWWKFWKKKLDDDFSQFYSTTSEYNQAFGMERKTSLQTQTAIPVTKTTIGTATPEVKKDEKDYFQGYLKDKTRKVFAEYHVEDNTYETIIAIRANSRVQYSEKVLSNPSRIVFTFKDTVISALPAFEDVKTGAIISFKTIHTPVSLPAEYKDWNKLLSIILELDSEREYKIESQDDMFKIIIKK